MRRSGFTIACLLCLTAWSALSLPGACQGEEAATYPVTGQVLMPDGSPAAGAMVEARNWRKDWEVTTAAEADASGRFKMDLPVGRYYLQASFGVLVRSDWSDVAEVKRDGAITGPSELKLTKGCLVHGSVMDKTTGRLLSGVRILTRNGDHAETGPAGNFCLLLRKGNHTLTAIKDGFYRPIVHINCANQDTIALLVETKPEGIIKGRVTDQSGKPIAGARVGYSGTQFNFQTTKTDENGEYSLPGQDPDARIGIRAWGDGYEWERNENVTFPPGRREVTLDFVLVAEKYRDISGRVIQQDGVSVRGAKVSYGYTDCYAGYKETTTDEGGKFLLEHVNAGNNLVVAEAKGFAPAFKFVEGNLDAQVELTMEPGHWLEGKFVDEEGNPVEGVGVSLDVETEEMAKMGFCGGADKVYRWASSRTSSDKDGHFRLEDLPAGRILIETYKPGYTRIDQMPLDVDRKDHVIVVTKRGHISGTVLQAANGQPVAQFKVYLDFPMQREPGDKTSGLSPGLVEQGVSFNSADGKFTISGQNTGHRLRVIAEAPGFLRQEIDRVLVMPASQVDHSKVVFRLRPAISFEGFVTEADTDNPLEGVLVTVLDRPGGWFSWSHGVEDYHPILARTDAGGKFRFESISIQRGTIMLEKSGYGRVLLAGTSLSKPLQASMAKGGTIKGMVKDDSGRPLAGADVSVEYSGRSISFGWLKTDADGKFRMTDLPPGRYNVLQHGDRRATRMTEFDLAAGQEYEADFDRPGEALVEGKVTCKGVPQADIRVRVNSRDSGDLNGFGVTDKQGTYKLSIYKPGEYNVTWEKGEWMDPNRISVRRAVSLKKGMNRFDIALPEAGISGRVIDKETGKPVPKAKVRAYVRETEAKHLARTGWSWQHTEPLWWPKNKGETDADGRFEMKNLAEGEWMVGVAPEGGSRARSHSQPFKLAKAEAKKGIVLYVTELGAASVLVLDAKTGEPVPKPCLVVCQDEIGFGYYPDRDESCDPSGCSVAPFKLTNENQLTFSDLPPGRYRAFAMTETLLPGSAEFEVKPGQTTEVALKLQAGGRIVFRLDESEGDEVPGIPWVGFKISKPGVNKPVLEDYSGPYWGDVRFVSDEPPREAAVPIKPGTYRVEAVLRSESQAGLLSSDIDLWSGTSTVEVEAGKDAIIEIPWRE